MAVFEIDAYSPRQVAAQVQAVGVVKARLPLLAMYMLGVCAGGFIGLGSLYSVLVFSDPTLPFVAGRLLGGVAFSLGLVLVVVAGAELFTGNNLLVMAWADGMITTAEVARNWIVVYLANAVGAIGLALVVWLSQHGDLNQGAVAATYVEIAALKTALPFWEAFFKGVLCNLLVCLAVWMAMAGRGVTDKIIAVVFPISAFVAAGFEHCVANMYLIPLGILLSTEVPAVTPAPDWWGLVSNLVPVTLGNIAGGSIMIAAVYHLVYGRALKKGSWNS
ncbi:MAG TPA: formate/nitrite transporter family protein [Burkholderiales bacterium]|jgi:formate/nitrite transporter